MAAPCFVPVNINGKGPDAGRGRDVRSVKKKTGKGKGREHRKGKNEEKQKNEPGTLPLARVLFGRMVRWLPQNGERTMEPSMPLRLIE